MLVTNVNSIASCIVNSMAIDFGMGKKKKAELEQWQLDDVARLNSLFAEKVKEKGQSQAAFGAESGIGTQGMVWQYLNAHTPLNYDALMKFSEGMGVKAKEISPVLWGKIEKFFYSQSDDERVFITGEQRKALSSLVSVLNPAELMEVEKKRVKQKRGQDLGPKARKIGYGMGDSIRKGEYLTEEEPKEKRKNNGDTI